MRGPNLQAVRSRVDRLAAAVATRACDGNHAFVKFSGLDHTEPMPSDWPPTDATDRCGCGRRLTYTLVRFVNV